jgi:hypothetical protein
MQNKNMEKILNNLEISLNKNDLSKMESTYKFLNKKENKLPLYLTTKYHDILLKIEQLFGKKDEKGFWEYSIFQKIIIPNEEQNIKSLLKPENTFDLKKLDYYTESKISKEEQLVLNYNIGLKLSNKDMIIYNSYLEQKKNELKKDLDDIKTLGVKATPVTNEGKIHYIMYLLDNFIRKNQIDNIANIYLKLKDPKYLMNNILKEQYKNLLNDMNKFIDQVNLIELQFTKFYNQMPPLNEKGFNKLDDWQIETINNINNNISTIICAPTSAGKSIISGYVVTKGRSLYIVPTDALAWQVAAYIGGIINCDVPIITLTYQSNPKRDEFIKLLNNSDAIVGTPENILDFLPFINANFKWVIYDEIHMMGKKEGYAIESISKILNKGSFLGLSATIGNVNELRNWFSKISNQDVKTIICDKRFFNLQKYYYDHIKNDFIMLNPLSLVTIAEFEDKSILKKTLYPTPQDTWSLVNKLISKNIDLGEINPISYFDKNELIELNKTYKYFIVLINFMVNNYDKYHNEINEILNEYSSFDFDNYEVNLIDVIEKLRETNKFPAIIFQQNTISCLEIVRKLAEDLDNKESDKYNNLRKDRLQKEKDIKRQNKKIEKELNNLSDKQLDKKIKEVKDFNFEFISENAINSPHEDFIFNKDDRFSDNEIKEWAEKFKIYFPCVNGDYHYLIRLLWRGIGVYVNGLPHGYLRLIQTLATKKKLAVVFSDISLVFGISMPFRCSIIYKNNKTIDNLDSMMYHQMAGRAGRRGLDKEGNVIFVGYSWNRIKELSKSSIPNINGSNKILWSLNHANLISADENYLLINKNQFDNKINNEYIETFDNNLKNNLNSLWKFSIDNDKNLIQLMWMFRYSNEGIIISYLLDHLKNYFGICNPNEESKQIELAYFLSKFIDINEPDSLEDTIPDIKSNKINYNLIYEELKKINIEIPNYIDGKIWLSIRNNSLVEMNNDLLRQKLFDFSTKLKALQHYCYHTKQINLTKLLGKLLTRIWWIYHSSSPLLNN